METNTAPTVGPKPARYKPARSYPAGHFRPKRKVDPSRRALADAVKEAERQHERVARCRAGIERARAARFAAERAVVTAEENVQKAAKEHASAVAVAATDNAALPVSGVRAARQAVTDAKDELEAARTALDQLKADLPDLIAEAGHADVAVESAISAILAPEVQALLVRARSVQKLFAPLRATLRALFERGPTNAAEYMAWDRGRKHLGDVLADVRQFFETIDVVEKPPENPWKKAREALRSNPHAQLPAFSALSPNDEAGC